MRLYEIMQHDLLMKFQKQVLFLVRKIPCGKVATYSQLAKLAGQPTHWRQVGRLMNQNKDPRIVCYRVIRSNGQVGGYNQGVRQKIRRLQKEAVLVKNGKIDLRKYLWQKS